MGTLTLIFHVTTTQHSSYIVMKLLVILAISSLAYAKHLNPAIRFADSKIIGGSEAPKHEFPWQISLRNLGSHICGGSIINENQVITAAHCVEGGLPILDSIVAGAHDRFLESGHQKRNIKSMEHHEDHNNPQFDNDVALITVTEPFDFSDPHVQPIEMLMNNTDIPAETICNSTGWGLTNGGGLFLPNHLQWIQIPIHSHDECEEIFPGYITDGMVCAGGPGAATCNGDSGGPLVCPDANGERKLVGLVSFGYTGCTDAGVYTKVSHYEDWIQERVIA